MPWVKWVMVMYNRYQGNSGKVQRIPEREKPKPEKPKPVPPRKPPPLKSVEKASPISALLPKGLPDLETEDLILLLVLYLMYRKSGDSDLLIIMGAMFFL